MKVSSLKPILLKTLATVLAVFIPFALAIKSAAQEPGDIDVLRAFRVKFLGGDNEALLFNVKYNNKDRSSYKLLVLDETGEALFEDSYSKDLDKKLTIPRLTDSEHVIFIVKSENDSDELHYKVRITTRVVDDAIVSRN